MKIQFFSLQKEGGKIDTSPQALAQLVRDMRTSGYVCVLISNVACAHTSKHLGLICLQRIDFLLPRKSKTCIPIKIAKIKETKV